MDEMNYVSLDEATKLFSDALHRRRKTWVYDWMIPLIESELNEVETAKKVVDFRSHISVQKIRRKLHELQLKMPAWTLLSQIVKLARQLKQEEIETFVQESVRSLLLKLYGDLKLCENAVCAQPPTHQLGSDVVNVILAQNLGTKVAKPMEEQMGFCDFFVHSRTVDTNRLLSWMQDIYAEGNVVNGVIGNYSPSLRIIGPVGERPLHVCFLRANEFKSKSAEDCSIRQGILNGAKNYIEENDKAEAAVPYGKDYCAAVGSRILDKKVQNQSLEWEGQQQLRGRVWEKLSPPYYEYLVHWVNQTYLKTPEFEIEYDSRKIVSVGLYEGETILYFSITSKDSETVKWLLAHDVKADQGLDGLFFRPRERHSTANDGLLEWRRFFIREKHYKNEFSASPKSYFGLDPIFFAASQGPDQECERIMQLLVRHVCHVHATDSTRKDGALARAITPASVINKPDEYGNTPLHLAAWNGSKEIFAWLMQNGADLRAVNNNGLSPLSLTARYGLWDMFGFIRRKFLAHSIWQYGFVLCRDYDFSHIDTSRNIQDYANNKAASGRLLDMLRYLEEKYPRKPSSSQMEPRVRALEHDISFSFDRESIMRAAAALATPNPKADGVEDAGGFRKSRFIGTLEIIRLYRPEGWHDAINDCIEDLALKKWRKCYCFVYIGQTCVPTFITFVIFGLMWQYRKVVLRENSGIPGWFAAPPLVDDLEAQCGWASIQNSLSGRLQAVLVIYGVLAMLAVAVEQQRIGIHDMAGKGGNRIESFNLADFFYLNLKPILCIISSAMFIAIGSARIMAGTECKTVYLQAEKNATAIAALFLFANLLNLLRPIQIFGAFFITIFKMIVTDLFRFSVVYMSFFLAFLVAIQTLYQANNHFIEGIVTDSLLNISDLHARRKTGISGGVLGSSGDEAVCSAKIMQTSDTAFKMLAVSLGDGFSDILQDSRARRDLACGGFQADYLLIILYFAWIVLTNILAMNLLIAMLSRTFSNNFEASRDNWILDIVARVIRYDQTFPELLQRAHRPTRTTLSLKNVLEDICLTLVCVPEISLLIWVVRGIKRYCYSGGRAQASKMSTELRKFLNQGEQNNLISDTMPSLLDSLLENASDGKIEAHLQKEHKDVDVEFLKLGLAYHISRKQDSVRLSTKLIVKNYSKQEREMEEEEEKAREMKEKAKGKGGAAKPRELSQHNADQMHTASMPTQTYMSEQL